MLIHEGNKLVLKQKIWASKTSIITSKFLNEMIRQTTSHAILSIIKKDRIAGTVQEPAFQLFENRCRHFV